MKMEVVEMRPVGWAAALICLIGITAPGASYAQSFVEGYVFAKRSGRPVSFASVRLVENVTFGTVPVVLALAFTDNNGFFQMIVEEENPFIGSAAAIEISCDLGAKVVSGGAGILVLRGAGTTINRDVYLKTRRTRCEVP